MNCDGARDSIILAAYGELPDDEAIGLEQHLAACEECLHELEAMRQLDQLTLLHPMVEPNANLVAQSRMRLDEALDAIPQHGFLTRLRADAVAWFSHLKSAPALATLLLGVGFLSGNFTHRWQDDHAAKPPQTVILSKAGGGISTISGISQLPHDMVKVSYNRVVQEEAEGSLDDPQIRKLLMVGTLAADSNDVRAESVAYIARECQTGNQCDETRAALLSSLRRDHNPVVRLRALEGLQRYVSQDNQVRDAVSQTLLTDASAAVRTRAMKVLEPVDSDTTVRQVLRTVSTTDDNPYLRTASTERLRDSSSLQ